MHKTAGLPPKVVSPEPTDMNTFEPDDQLSQDITALLPPPLEKISPMPDIEPSEQDLSDAETSTGARSKLGNLVLSAQVRTQQLLFNRGTAKNEKLQAAKAEADADPANKAARLKYLARYAGVAATSSAVLAVAARYAAPHLHDLPFTGVSTNHEVSVSNDNLTAFNVPTTPNANIDTHIDLTDIVSQHSHVAPSNPTGANQLPTDINTTAHPRGWFGEQHQDVIGDYTSTAFNDGTGHAGTAWHSVLEDVHHLGFDTTKLNDADKSKIVDAILKDNHLTAEQASNLPSNYHLNLRSSDATIKLVQEVTAANHGKAFEPTAGSPAYVHLNSINSTPATPPVHHPGSRLEEPDVTSTQTTQATTPSVPQHPVATPSSHQPLPHPTATTSGHVDTSHTVVGLDKSVLATGLAAAGMTALGIAGQKTGVNQRVMDAARQISHNTIHPTNMMTPLRSSLKLKRNELAPSDDDSEEEDDYYDRYYDDYDDLGDFYEPSTPAAPPRSKPTRHKKRRSLLNRK